MKIDEALSVVNPTSEFIETVRQDVKSGGANTPTVLLSNPQMWYDVLVNFKAEVEAQLSEKRGDLEETHVWASSDWHVRKRTYFDARSEFASWKSSANWWKVHVQRRIADVKRLLEVKGA